MLILMTAVVMEMSPPLTDFNDWVTRYMEGANPFPRRAYADALSLIPFAILALLLYLEGS